MTHAHIAWHLPGYGPDDPDSIMTLEADTLEDIASVAQAVADELDIAADSAAEVASIYGEDGDKLEDDDARDEQHAIAYRFLRHADTLGVLVLNLRNTADKLEAALRGVETYAPADVLGERVRSLLEDADGSSTEPEQAYGRVGSLLSVDIACQLEECAPEDDDE